ncbi:MAG TPA: alpha-galactosidase [Galbitalea sp.]|jgi:alpha-galactosidase
MSFLILRGHGGALVLDVSGDVPVVVHWGADLGPNVPASALSTLPVPHSHNDQTQRQELVPQASSGWRGRPALEGHRADGSAFSPRLRIAGDASDGNGRAEVTLMDAAAGLRLVVELSLTGEGMLRTRSVLTNTADTDYFVDALRSVLPVGTGAAEILDLTGRWCREQHPQRQRVRQGTWLREYRHGRTGHDSSLFTAVGTPGFTNRTGKVWATHFGFSGNHETYVEKTAAGPALIGSGELFAPGELVLAPGEHYTTPWTYAAFSSTGIDGITEIFHNWMRARDGHPSSPRPVVLNTWEAVYFDHRLDQLVELADRAKEIGVERFVLDDGWFMHRRNDLAGLGDWEVDPAVWPDGLDPLIDAVTTRGMQFGLWVEPEMVNEDSDVIRAHPEWISGPGGDVLPEEWRHQQVIDLVNPDAWQYVYDRIDALLRDNAISYLKWDQNRDLTEMGHDGAPSTSAQTRAAYRLFDELRSAHPTVEIESCSSGGARVDLGILERTDRVWASDCNDALERQTIQRWTQAILPPELVGTHVGPTTAHTTGRTHSLSFRAITAMFGHFGMEWDVRELEGGALEELKQAVALFKQYRPLIHSGIAVHGDIPDPAYVLTGAVAREGSEALYSFVSVATSFDELPGRIALPGLDPDASYRIECVFPTATNPFNDRGNVEWIESGASATGLFLAEVGLAMPILNPETGILIALTRE